MLSTYEKQLQSSPAYQEFNKTIVIPLEDDLFKVFKVPPGYQIVVLFDCIQSHVCHKLPLPEGKHNQLTCTHPFRFYSRSLR